jgi:hypothetical protein
MGILREPKVWRKPRGPRETAQPDELTPIEEARVPYGEHSDERSNANPASGFVRQAHTSSQHVHSIVPLHGGAVRELRDLLRDDLALRARVDDHERRLLAVERRPG